MRSRRAIKSGGLVSAAVLVSGLWFVSWQARGAGGLDGVNLSVDRGPGEFEVTLSWTGGQPTFEVYGSSNPDDVTDPANWIWQTEGRSFVDLPPPGDVFFYRVTSPCVFDPPERCDDVDNDCDGDIDEDNPGGGGECDGPDLDLCLEGVFVCTAGELICNDNTGDDIDVCDGSDNDCNPTTPDGFHDPQQGASCDGPDTDLCQEGSLDCVAGSFQCSDNSGSTFDVCDGLDNDCDPASPDGSEDPQQGQPCDGDDLDLCLEGAFVCTAGELICNDNTGDDIDVCDGSDNDCNPTTPDGFHDPQQGASCDGPDTDLCQEGSLDCVAGSFQCSDNSGSTFDVCDGLDNDCDPASPDGSEDPQQGQPCDGDDLDLCLEGAFVCTAGELICNDNTGDDIDVCDGSDNDCNPTTPDGFHDPQQGASCDGPDTDLCPEGSLSCVAGSFQCSDNSGDDLDVCDGADNDCDPTSPDGSEDPLQGVPCDGPDPDLCEEGSLNCVAGNFQCSDNTGDTPEQCNGLDDDCDDQVDENGSALCDDFLFCTADTCLGAPGCANPVLPGTCSIQEQCFTTGQQNPGNPCEICDPTVSQNSWTAAMDGTPCGPDMTCQGGFCI